MPLAFTPLLWIAGQCPWGTWRGYAAALITLGLLGQAVLRYDPRTPEQYVTPSRLSYLIQSRFPTLYNPAPEIFMERFSGHGEERAYDLIVGPDRRKTLLINNVKTPGAMAPNQCLFDNDKLSAYRRAIQAEVPKPYGYVYLSDAQAMAMLLQRLARAVQARPGRQGRLCAGPGLGPAGTVGRVVGRPARGTSRAAASSSTASTSRSAWR
jgi:hypothetical protein